MDKKTSNYSQITVSVVFGWIIVFPKSMLLVDENNWEIISQ